MKFNSKICLGLNTNYGKYPLKFFIFQCCEIKIESLDFKKV